MLRFLFALVIITAAALTASAQTPTATPNPDDILLDATFVPCTDTTESLLILNDGRAVYALGNRGASFTINEMLMADLRGSVDTTVSFTDTTSMDSCATLGLILDGPRFLLINRHKPQRHLRELYAKIERIRKFAERRMAGTLERYADKMLEEPDSTLDKPPSIAPTEIRRRMRLSPIAKSWRCSGTVTVAALVSNKGRLVQALVQRVQARGKCQSIMTTAALRAVLLSTVEPATNKKGRPMASWMQVDVPFVRQRPGS